MVVSAVCKDHLLRAARIILGGANSLYIFVALRNSRQKNILIPKLKILLTFVCKRSK